MQPSQVQDYESSKQSIDAIETMLYEIKNQISQAQMGNVSAQALSNQAMKHIVASGVEWDESLKDSLCQNLDVIIMSIEPLVNAANELERAAIRIEFAEPPRKTIW